jgi:hypothetical protein
MTHTRPARPSSSETLGVARTAGGHNAAGEGVIVVFAPAPQMRDARLTVPLDAPVVRVSTWEAVLAMAPLADVVLAVPGGDAAYRVELARTFARVVGEQAPRAVRRHEQTRSSGSVHRGRRPRGLPERVRVPLIMAAPFDERDTLLRAGVTKVVAVDAHACGRFWLVVEAAALSALLTRFGDRLPALRIGDALRDALSLLGTAPCPASILSLCAALGIHRRTLWYQWQARARSRAPGARLEDAVASAVFAHALASWSEGATWTAVATTVGVHRHTLARVAVRIIGLDGLPARSDAAAHMAFSAARRALATHLVRPVMGPTIR